MRTISYLNSSLRRARMHATLGLAAAVAASGIITTVAMQPASAEAQADVIARQVGDVAPGDTGAALALQEDGSVIRSESTPPGEGDFGARQNVYTSPRSSTGTVRLSNGDGSPLAIGLPDVSLQAPVIASDNVTAVYQATSSGETSVAIQTFEDGARIHTVLANASAPTSFSYPIQVPSGGNIEDLGGGMIAINDSAGEVTGYVNTPWARDKNGAVVGSRFEIVGNSIIQYVDHRNRGFAYPIVADPYFGKSLIKSAKWSWRSNQWTLMVSPTWWARFNAGSKYVGEKGWKELYKKYKYVGLNYNLGGMRDQFICHQQYAFYKSTWNLDEKRKNVSYNSTVKALCNPKWMSGHKP